MTRDEIIEFQNRERAFLETPIGKALYLFKVKHARYWQSDGSDTISDKRLRELSEASDAAERALRDLIEPIAQSKGE